VSGGLVVLDFDGEGWREAYEEFLKGFVRLSRTRAVETGGGKLHLWTRCADLPGNVTRLVRSFGNASVELRANNHYVLAPPSIHPSGKQYKFIDPDLPIVELSRDELERIVQWFQTQEPSRRKGAGRVSSPRNTTQYAPAATHYLEEAIRQSRPGNRNETGFRLACQLRNLGLPEEEAGFIIHQYVESVPEGDHPYVLEEALASLKSAYNGPRRPSAIPESLSGLTPTIGSKLPDALLENLVNYPPTDAGNAESFRDLFGREFCYVPQIGKWFHWNGVQWGEDDAAYLAMLDTVRLRARAAMALVDGDRRKKILGWTQASESHAKLSAALLIAQSLLRKNVADFDCGSYVLPCANGVVDLRTGHLRSPTPDDFPHRCTHVNYDPTIEFPRWLQFLDEVFPGNKHLVEFIHRAVGYTLTGDTSEQCFFILHGAGANGKSTFLGILEDLLGDFALATSARTFKDHQGHDGIPNDIARMCGVRLVKAIEFKEGARLNEERIKALTGGDRVAARFLYHELFDFVPTFKLWLAVNRKPVIRGTDEAIWRRIRLIPFQATFPQGKRDPRLKDKLRKELPGILAWAVQGCLKWQRKGLKPPQRVKRETQNYRTESDVIERFLKERTVCKGGVKVTASELYNAYHEWCAENRETSVSATAFGRGLVEKGFQRKKSGSRYYEGITLRAAR
jgi:putative DNA primase/helicase